jgi:hypothetical protein
MSKHSGTWTGRDPLVDEDGVYVSTVEQRGRVTEVVVANARTDVELGMFLSQLGLS